MIMFFTIALQADRVGSDVWTMAYLYKAYAKALSLLPKKMHFYFYSEVTSDFLGKKLTSRNYTHANPENWAKHARDQIYATVQSNEKLGLHDFVNTFYFFLVPKGAGSKKVLRIGTARAY